MRTVFDAAVQTHMSTRWIAGAFGCLALGLLGGCASDLADSSDGSEVTSTAEAVSSTAYSGRASVLLAQVLGISTGVADTGQLPTTGGTLQASVVTANVPGLFSAAALDASTMGSNGETVSKVTASDVHLGVTLGLGVGSVAVGANVLSSNATAVCTNGVPTLGGSTVITALTINGKPVVVTGAPNQTVDLLLGKVVINEQSTTLSGPTGSIHAAPIHVIVAGLADVSICPSDAGITCAPAPTCTDGIKNGGETGVDCGGPACAPCANGGGCAQNSDCQSGDCQGGACVAPTCTPTQYVTGQGSITSTPTGQAGSFSLYAQIVSGAPTGYVTYDDEGSAEQIQSVDVTSFTVSGSYSQIVGTANVQNKAGTFAYTVDTIDNGGNGDVFYITVGDGYQAGGTVVSGRVQLVNACQ
jgi:hypothetical protein